MDTDPIATFLVRVHGRVQGVGYRWQCVQQAREIGLAGWVRNRMDGSVEALLQGPREPVERMCEWMREEVESALVERMDVREVLPPFARLQGFEQRPTE